MTSWQQGPPNDPGQAQVPQYGPVPQVPGYPAAPNLGDPQQYPAVPQYGAPQYGAIPGVTAPYPGGVPPQYGQFGDPAYAVAYGPHTPEPNGATGIIAGILSLLGGAAQLLGVIGAIGVLALLSSVKGAADLLPGWYSAVMIVIIVVDLVLGVALVTGGVGLLMRRLWARIVVAAACVLALIGSIAGLVVTNAIYDASPALSTNRGTEIVSGIGGLIFPIVTLTLALLPATKIWCEARRR
ncbi:hypothetical protein HUN08_02010 [Gordonia sp. X0973]|uniref:hypothetical protein n=1 Tax=Gordonia sp. X0973 TaxID=2742602 RepID=UPI000F5211E1|nr:hypothetical protein [Gordonia sp. X0973]QKT06100.1 hypothetical protein HUN08_02010 [Gordonia sp. X0973]